MADLEEYQMEEIDDDPIHVMLEDEGTHDMVCSVELIIRCNVNVLMTIAWFLFSHFSIGFCFLKKVDTALARNRPLN